MELLKPTTILLALVFSGFLSPFFAQAICVPRNSTSSIILPPASAPAPAPASSSISPAPAYVDDDDTEPNAAFLDSAINVPSDHVPSRPLQIPHTPNPALKMICDKTDHAQECMDSLLSSATGVLNPTSVLQLEVQALQKSYKAGLDLAHSLYYGSSSDVQNSLDVCLDVFGSGVSDLDTSFKAITSKDGGTLNSMLSAAVDYPDTCDDAFDEMGGEPVLKDVTQKLSMLASNCLAISELLPWN